MCTTRFTLATTRATPRGGWDFHLIKRLIILNHRHLFTAAASNEDVEPCHSNPAVHNNHKVGKEHRDLCLKGLLAYNCVLCSDEHGHCDGEHENVMEGSEAPNVAEILDFDCFGCHWTPEQIRHKNQQRHHVEHKHHVHIKDHAVTVPGQQNAQDLDIHMSQYACIVSLLFCLCVPVCLSAILCLLVESHRCMQQLRQCMMLGKEYRLPNACIHVTSDWHAGRQCAIVVQAENAVPCNKAQGLAWACSAGRRHISIASCGNRVASGCQNTLRQAVGGENHPG